MIPNMRPNVFTTCNIIEKPPENHYKAIGIIGKRTTESNAPLEIKKVKSIEHAISLFGDSSNITAYAISIWQNVACEVHAIEVNDGDINQYKEAVDKFLKQEEIYCVVSDTNTIPLINHMKTRLENDNFCVNQKLCICNLDPNENAISIAQTTNCSRILIAYPDISIPFRSPNVSNGLLAAAISKGELIKSNLAGARLKGTYLFNQKLTEEMKNELLYWGVTVLEPIGSELEIIRAVTTKTINQLGDKDNTYRNISVVHALDTVSQSLTSFLKKRLNGITSATSSLGSILTLVICELSTLKQDGIISDYERPIVRLDQNDPSICMIEVSVLLAQGVNQIYINLNINL